MLDYFDSIPVAFAAAAPEQVTLTADDDNVPPEFTKIAKDSGLSFVTCAEIAKAIGMTREKWRAALESGLNSLKDGCLRPLTASEAHSVKPSDILPMKVVAGTKAPDASGYRRFKARGCACDGCGKGASPSGLACRWSCCTGVSGWRLGVWWAHHSI